MFNYGLDSESIIMINAKQLANDDLLQFAHTHITHQVPCKVHLSREMNERINERLEKKFKIHFLNSFSKCISCVDIRKCVIRTDTLQTNEEGFDFGYVLSLILIHI